MQAEEHPEEAVPARCAPEGRLLSFQVFLFDETRARAAQRWASGPMGTGEGQLGWGLLPDPSDGQFRRHPVGALCLGFQSLVGADHRVLV